MITDLMLLCNSEINEWSSTVVVYETEVCYRSFDSKVDCLPILTTFKRQSRVPDIIVKNLFCI